MISSVQRLQRELREIKIKGLVSIQLSGGSGLDLTNHEVLSSISASSTDLKRIQTPHSLFRDLEQIKPFQLVGQAAEFKFESKIEPLPVIWQSLPKAIPEDNRKF